MELEDTALLANLAPGDFIALEVKYHRKMHPKTLQQNKSR